MEILDLAIELPTFNYQELNPEGQKYIDNIASTYNLTKDQVLAQAKTKKVDVNRSSVTDLWVNALKRDEARIMEGIASIPTVIYEAAALVSDPINKALGLPETNLEAFEKAIGVDTVLESLIKEQEYRGKQAELFKEGRGIEGGVFDNFSEGNIDEGFTLLGEGIAGSAPTSIGIMLASASGVGLVPLAGGATTVLTGPELRAQKEKFPEQSNAVNMLKAVGMAGAEMVFTTISQGALGRVYKDVLLRQGVEQGRKTFKDGLIGMYETAIKKYGAVTSSLGEGIEEVATQITQNLIDGRPVFEGVADAFLIGFGSGGVYGAPINAAKGFKAVNEALAKTKINKKIKPTEFSDIVQVFESAETNEVQFDLAKTKRADAILVNELKRRVNKGEMTQQEADRIQKNFFDTSIIQVKLDKTNLNQEQKIQATNLLKEKEALTQTIEEVGDPSLTVAQQTRVDEINKQLASLSTITETIKTDKDAVQEPSSEKVDVQEQTRDGEDVGAGDIVTDEAARETTPQEEELSVEDTEIEEEVDVEEVKDLQYSLGIPETEQVTEEQVTEEQVTEEVPGTIDRFFGETIEETTEKVSDNLVVNRKEAVADKTTEQLNREQSVLAIATTAAKAISKLLPNTRIVLHDSATDFQNFVSDAQAEAEFNPSENVIHVDLSKATEITVPHEVFHAVFLNKVKTDKKATRQADLLVKKLNGNVPQKVQQEIETFVAKYEGAPEVQNEERLAELMGILARDYTNLEQPAQNFIKTFLKTLARTFGLRDIESTFDTENDVVKLLQTLAKKVKTGEEITEVDVEILEDGTNPVGNPTEIRVPKPRQRKVKFNDSYGLSLVTPDKSVDILSLIKDINSKGEKVWFWVADQLGLGEFEGVQLDAGPSFAFEGDAVWASSKSVKSIQKNIDAADYLFIISGSPQKSLLFNKKVYDVFTQRLGDYVTFKADALATNPTKGIKDALNKFNSWEEMRNSPDRKKFLIALRQQEGTTNTEFHKLVKSLNGFVDVNELRDSFYKDNNFGLNDVMVVIKPTSAREGSQHSTYANEVLGEVIGVPDQKVNAFDIMPQEMVDKYQRELEASEKSQAVAPYGSGIREIAAAPRQRKATVEQVAQQYNMDNQGFIPKTANLSQLRRAVEPFGLGAQRARTDQFGRGGGLFLTRNGRKFNPFKTTTRRRISTIEGQDLTIEGIIRAGRDQGFSDPAIRSVLRGRGFKAADINPAMELALLKDEVLPSAFQNIEQGAQEGLRLFRDLQSKLKTFTEQAERTKAEIRAKALELLQETEVYQALPEISQNELVLALDKSVGTRANRTVQLEISKIKKAVRGYKKGIADLRKAQIELKNFVRNALPVSKTYTQADIARNIAIISNVKSKQDLPAAVEKVLKNVENKRVQLKKSLIKRILSSAKKKSKAKIGISRKAKAQSLDARGQQFFKSAVEILENILLNQSEQVQTSIDELANKIDSEQNTDQVIDSVFEKDTRGEKLSTQETKLIDYILARTLFSEINNMSLEDVQQLEETLNQITKESISKLKQDRQLVAEENRKIKDEANEAIASNYEVLTETDSKGNVVFKEKEVIDEEQREVWESFRKFKIWDGIKKMSKYYQFTGVPVIYDYFRKKLAHLGSFTKILDKYQEGFFYKNIYDKLNVMSENALRGIYNQKDILNDLANSIPGITKGYKEISQKLFKGPIVIERTVNGKKRKRTFSANELLRIYALSLNEVQREKLKTDGFNDKILSRIEKELGPELTAFADNVVEYLSTSYFESVNDVYSSLNFTNLGYVENYFPTRTKTKLDSKLLEDGNFNAIFGAENSPALKARTDLKSKIVIDEGDTFTSVLDNHIDSMERFKSYAKGVRQMNAIFNAEGVQSLLYVTGLRNLIKQSINSEVNPDYGYSNLPNTIISTLNTKFTSFALAFRIIQIAKQSTSIINAFESYQFRPGKSTPVLDTLGFLADLSVVIATLPKQIKKAYKLSATFRDRIEKGLGGDVVGLESGAKFKALPKNSPLISKARQAFRTAGAAPTVLGDVIGVMGYMVNYNRNIKNGMSKKEALKAFNDYNATQQSRRNTDKIPLQRSKSELTRAFTMFGSMLFLQINKVATAQAAIMSKAKAGKFKQIKAKDLRAFALNLGVANALFVLTANIARLIKGDDEDKEEVLREVNKALLGTNLIYQVPLIGAAIEMTVARAEGKSGSYASSVVNPYISIYRKVNRYYETMGTEGAVIPLIELGLGAQIDPLVGLYNSFEGLGTFEEDDMYDILGISPSYRPRKRPKPKPPAKVEF